MAEEFDTSPKLNLNAASNRSASLTPSPSPRRIHVDSNKSVILTPPPPTSPSGRKKGNLKIKEFAKELIDPGNSKGDNVINLDDSDDDIQVVAEPIKAPTVPRVNSNVSYTVEDIQEIETKIKRLQSGISQNSYILASQHGRLPDGGNILRQTLLLPYLSLLASWASVTA